MRILPSALPPTLALLALSGKRGEASSNIDHNSTRSLQYGVCDLGNCTSCEAPDSSKILIDPNSCGYGLDLISPTGCSTSLCGIGLYDDPEGRGTTAYKCEAFAIHATGSDLSVVTAGGAISVGPGSSVSEVSYHNTLQVAKDAWVEGLRLIHLQYY